MKSLRIWMTFIVVMSTTMSGIESLGQSYSNFYGTYNVDASVKKNVSVNGKVEVDKTIKTIDYGALAQANALREQNRIELLKLEQQFESELLKAIASDPRVAFSEGEQQIWKVPRPIREELGWAKPTKTCVHRKPHESLFFRRENMTGYFYENRSSDGIVTTIQYFLPASVERLVELGANFNRDVESWLKYEDLEVGKVGVVKVGDTDISRLEAFVHDKGIRRATVGGFEGFAGKIVYEDNYEITIRDDFMSVGVISGTEYFFFTQIHTKANKGEVNFEELEGRRHYMSGLVYELTSRWFIK